MKSGNRYAHATLLQIKQPEIQNVNLIDSFTLYPSQWSLEWKLIGPFLSQSYDLNLTCRLEDMILASKKKKIKTKSALPALGNAHNICPAAASFLQG